MTIEINDSRTVREIQNEFSKKFPFLKLEFFPKPHQEKIPFEHPYKPDDALLDIREKHEHGMITISAGSKTGAVKREFEQRFGLNVQIYRLAMDRWVQSADADMLTLKEQNDAGKESAIFYNPDHQFTVE